MPEYELYQSNSESTYTFIEKGNPIALEKDAVKIWSTNAKSWEIACMRKHQFLEWEPYKPMILSKEDLFAFLPEDKHDIENLQLLIHLGYPTIEPILEKLFTWMQDYNWPVAQKLAPFLASLGVNCKPQIQKIFLSNDSMWKYWILTAVIAKMSENDKKFYDEDLVQLRSSLSKEDKVGGLEEVILEILK